MNADRGLRVRDRSQQPQAFRRTAHPLSLARVEATRNEQLELITFRSQDPERPVCGTREIPCPIGHSLQDRIQLEVRRDSHFPRVQILKEPDVIFTLRPQGIGPLRPGRFSL